jgi:uncharacterized protein (TIGR02444 family)
MTLAESNTAITPFWRFSLNFYRQAGVSDACIALQDDYGIDVNLLLFLLWLASEGRQVSPDEAKTFDDRVRSWRELTIIPIRDTRRKLKGAATLVEPDKQEAFRNKVKTIELEAEQLQQAALYDFTKSGPLGAPAAPQTAARANIAAYERATGKTFPKAAVDLLAAAFDAVAA